MKRVILATGGTGGHVFPALAAAEALKKRHPDVHIVFMGGKYGPETDIIAREGYDFVGLPVRGVIGRGVKGVLSAACMLRGVAQAVMFMRKFKPESVLGFGSYAAFAGVLAARILGVPAAIHEQNAIPGKTNRTLGKLVQRIYLSFPEVQGFPPEKTVWVGNPVRQGILETFTREVVEHRVFTGATSYRLLVLGGSLGATALNDALLAGARDFAQAGVQVWHQTGAADYERVRSGYQALGASHVRVEPFISDMSKAYLWADAAVCRAGGSTIAELLVAGLPAVLVPFPFATHNHQWHNAQYVASRNGAILLEQSDFSGTLGHVVLLEETLELLRNGEKRAAMSRACLALAKPQAAIELAAGLEHGFRE